MAYLDEDVLYQNIEEKYRVAKGEARKAFSDVLDTICEMPRANVVNVVRCEDCRYYETYYHCCKKHGHFVNMQCDGYCSYGERKEV
jgi:hypothetical protein